MRIVLDRQVEKTIDDWRRALSRYPISAERRRAKLRGLRRFLASLRKRYNHYPLCDYMMLGQRFNDDGSVVFPNLHKCIYVDESRRAWTFSYFVHEDEQLIVVHRMIFSDFVIE